VLRREERFGYFSLATNSKLTPQDFLRCSSSHGDQQVWFYAQRSYDLLTGDLIQEKDRQRCPSGKGDLALLSDPAPATAAVHRTCAPGLLLKESVIGT
jgi:hypothetical protein